MATDCTICPAGQWTFSDGARHETDCSPCSGSRSCLGGATARVTVQVLGVDVERIDRSASLELRGAYAEDLASTLEVAKASVQDLFGHAASSTVSGTVLSGQKGLKVSAFVTVPVGSSANALAEKLYTENFRSKIVNTTAEVLKRDGSGSKFLGRLVAPMVAIHPEPFVPLRPTTTVMTTSTVTSTGSSGVVAFTTTTTIHKDITSSEAST